jgi:hypothetical protein
MTMSELFGETARTVPGTVSSWRLMAPVSALRTISSVVLPM